MKTQNYFPPEKQVTFLDIDQLGQALEDLRHERKWMFEEHLKDTETIYERFQKKLIHGILLEEQVLFPFLERHIPRITPLMAMLRQEHWDLSQSMQTLREHFACLKMEPLEQALEAVHQQSLYLNFLMRTHLLAERMGIYRIADRELHWEEKKLLEQKLAGTT